MHTRNEMSTLKLFLNYIGIPYICIYNNNIYIGNRASLIFGGLPSGQFSLDLGKNSDLGYLGLYLQHI